MAKLRQRVCADVFLQCFPINVLSNLFAICTNGDKSFKYLDLRTGPAKLDSDISDKTALQ